MKGATGSREKREMPAPDGSQEAPERKQEAGSSLGPEGQPLFSQVNCIVSLHSPQPGSAAEGPPPEGWGPRPDGTQPWRTSLKTGLGAGRAGPEVAGVGRLGLGRVATCWHSSSILSLYLSTSQTTGRSCLGAWKKSMGLDEYSGRKNQASHGVFPGEAGKRESGVLSLEKVGEEGEPACWGESGDPSDERQLGRSSPRPQEGPKRQKGFQGRGRLLVE